MGSFSSKNDQKQVEDNKDAYEQKLRQIVEGREQLLLDSGRMSNSGQSLEILGIEYEKYAYPFENLVFEGGGTMGVAYCGAVKVLERAGIRKQIRRFAGASAGAMCATFLALGYTAEEMEKSLIKDLTSQSLFESRMWMAVPNVLRHFGWHNGNRVLDYFGKIIEAKLGNPEASFMQMYKQTGLELCIIVTDVNLMCATYCHPKTTPDMPIRLALRMSVGIPGMFQAKQYIMDGYQNHFVDGGLTCNYPIHCFDGWWLSMKPEDTFLRRLLPFSEVQRLFDKSERFGTKNEKTLGFMVCSNDECDIMTTQLNQRVHRASVREIHRPDTKLSRKRLKESETHNLMAKECDRVSEAAERFLQVLQKSDVNKDGNIQREELREAFEMTDIFSAEDAFVLFGEEKSPTDAFNLIDFNKDGTITYEELTRFIEKNGVQMTSRFIGYSRVEFSGVTGFLDALLNTMLLNLKRVYSDMSDLTRTVGINTEYIHFDDYDMEMEDRQYLMAQGERSTVAFLRQYVTDNSPSRISGCEHDDKGIKSEI